MITIVIISSLLIMILDLSIKKFTLSISDNHSCNSIILQIMPDMTNDDLDYRCIFLSLFLPLLCFAFFHSTTFRLSMCLRI